MATPRLDRDLYTIDLIFSLTFYAHNRREKNNVNCFGKSNCTGRCIGEHVVRSLIIIAGIHNPQTTTTTHRKRKTARCSSASWSEQEYSDEKKRTKMRALSEAHKSFLGSMASMHPKTKTCSSTSKRTIWTGIAPRRRTCKFGKQQQMSRRISLWRGRVYGDDGFEHGNEKKVIVPSGRPVKSTKGEQHIRPRAGRSAQKSHVGYEFTHARSHVHISTRV